MPYSFDLLDQEQKKKQNGEVDALGAPAMTGGGQQFTGGGAPSMTPQTAAPQAGTNTQGSGFVSLDKYMKANQGNTLGSQVTGNVQSAVDQGKQNLAKGAEDFTNASNQGATKWNDVEGDVKNTVASAGANTTPDDAKKFKGYLDASYQGPEHFLETASGTQAMGSAQKANQQAKALQSEGGRFALLDQFFGRPTYNTGQKSLDNLLVQNDKKTAARSQNLNSQSQQLSNAGAQRTKELDNFAMANKAATEETAKGARGAVGIDGTGSVVADPNAQGYGALGQQYKSAADKLAADQAARKADIEGIRGGLGSGELSDNQMKSTGLSTGQKLYDLDLSKYLAPGNDLSMDESMTPEQRARIRALSQLAGIEDTFAAGEGRDPGSDYSFDLNRFNADERAAESRYQSQAKGILSRYFPGSDPSKTPNWDNPDTYVPMLNQWKDYINSSGPTVQQKQAAVASRDRYQGIINELKSLRVALNPTRTLNPPHNGREGNLPRNGFIGGRR